MSEFCAQCAKANNMKNGFINECKPNFLALVMCEGCGSIQVNHKGECVSSDCGKNHAVEWKVKKKKWCVANGKKIKDIADANYGTVKIYHKDAWKAVYGIKLTDLFGT